jgi:hypothetical protein
MTCAYKDFGVIRPKLNSFGGFRRDILGSKCQKDVGVKQADLRVFGESLDRLLEDRARLIVFFCREKLSALVLGRSKFPSLFSFSHIHPVE